MSTETAFIGASTALGKYWTKRRFFDYLITKENYAICNGKKFQMMILLDPALSHGSYKSRKNVEADTKLIDFMINSFDDIKSELTIFITTCDMLPYNADENTPIIEESDDPFVQNRIKMYQAVNKIYGHVLNVHVPELAIPDPAFSPVLDCCVNPPAGRTKLPFIPNQKHQFYFPERIMGDVERCIPLGIPAIIPAVPPLETQEVIESLAPKLLSRLPKIKEEDSDKPCPLNSERTSIHSFHWLDPQDGYFVTKSDQIALLQFYFGDI